MMRSWFVGLFRSAILCSALVWNAPVTAQIWTEQPQKNLGDGLYLKIRVADKPGPVFFIPHDNENVAVEAVERLGRGTLVELKQQHKGHPGKQIRYIAQKVKAGLVFADPNRIYTSAQAVRRNFAPHRRFICGVRMRSSTDRATVTRFMNLGKTLTEELETLVATADRPLLVAVHNNTSAYGSGALSVEFEEFKSRLYQVCKSGDTRCGSHSGSTAEKRNPNNFFLVTDPEDFDLLKKQGWHAILQQPGREGDDGSLSYWATLGDRAGRLRYVNVEAEHGTQNHEDCPVPRKSQWETQIRMLQAIVEPSPG